MGNKFIKNLIRAAKEIATWPEWKKNAMSFANHNKKMIECNVCGTEYIEGAMCSKCYK